MNEAIENKIIELIDQGKTQKTLLSLKIFLNLQVKQKTLENLLKNDNLKNLFADEYVKFNNKIDSVNNKEVTSKRAQSYYLKPL